MKLKRVIYSDKICLAQSSASIIVGAFVFPLGKSGIADASHTRRPIILYIVYDIL